MFHWPELVTGSYIQVGLARATPVRHLHDGDKDYNMQKLYLLGSKGEGRKQDGTRGSLEIMMQTR